MYAPNSVEYAIVLHGAMLAGAIVTTLNPLYRSYEVERQLVDTGARLVIAAHSLTSVVEEVRLHLPAPCRMYEIEGAWEMIGNAGGDPLPVERDPAEELAVLPYSSGTTGLPKGVMLSHQNLTTNLRQIMALRMTTEQSTALSFLPFYHIYGMMVLNCGLAIGLTQVLVPRFDPEQILRLTDQHRVTDLYCVPPAILALVDAASHGRYNLSSLRLITSGAAPLPLEVARQAAASLGCGVSQGYGLTESSSTTNVTPTSAPCEGSVGPPVADTVEKIVDTETGDELPPGEAGELLVQGPQVMLGYWNNADATADAFTPDGWLRTGDIASVDINRYVRIHDRKKEMIKVKGYQVMPAELEAALMEHHAVRDAAVIPKHDGEAGEVPKAFVVLREPADLAEVAAFVAERLAPYKRLRYIEATDAIPRALSGKILRRQLIEQERAKDP
jgi:acyl-CoA synthetase (AMP-forming)/AMP-acid ligase II